MTKQNASEFLPLMTALSEGKTLQFRLHSSAPWGDCANPTFNRPASCYRIKPEPRKLYQILFSKGQTSLAYYQLSEAQSHCPSDAKIITFVEQE